MEKAAKKSWGQNPTLFPGLKGECWTSSAYREREAPKLWLCKIRISGYQRTATVCIQSKAGLIQGCKIICIPGQSYTSKSWTEALVRFSSNSLLKHPYLVLSGCIWNPVRPPPCSKLHPDPESSAQERHGPVAAGPEEPTGLSEEGFKSPYKKVSLASAPSWTSTERNFCNCLNVLLL